MQSKHTPSSSTGMPSKTMCRFPSNTVSGLYFPLTGEFFDFDDMLSFGGRLKETMYIGRHRKNDIVLEDGAVSATHCKILRNKDGTFTLVDTKSRHGVRVNDIPTARTEILPGMWITLARKVELMVISEGKKMPILAGSMDSLVVNSVRDYGSRPLAARFIGRSVSTISRILKRIRRGK